MKCSLLLLGLLALGASVLARAQDYPDQNRFIQYNVKGTSAFILEGTKTGCQYLTQNTGSSYTLVVGSCKREPGNGIH